MFRAPRGIADIIPADQHYWHYIREKATALAHHYGYQRIDTPVFEEAGLFVRTVGQESDIVQKEMYTFQDRGGDLMTLRPEGTAPVCRAYLEHGMHNLPQPVRLYYFCPVFRYERPQQGRYRQHHQFGLEVLGDPDPVVDAEVVSVAWRLLHELGLRGLSLLINSIGDSACRPAYLQELRAYYGHRVDRLCTDCRGRYQRNPLRLLDCKQESCRSWAEEAPRSVDHLCGECADHWERLQNHLGVLAVPFGVDHRLVRGLDYYTRTVFEIQPPEEGAQSTLCGGGRYDGLMQELGGRPTPGVGFAAGMERMVANLKRQAVSVPVVIPPLVVLAYRGRAAQEEALRLSAHLRAAGIGAVLAPGGKSLKGQMRHASALEAPWVLILGEEEVQQGSVTLRNMAKGEQQSLPATEVAAYILAIR